MAVDVASATALLRKIAEVGRAFPAKPDLGRIAPLAPFAPFADAADFDAIDGSWSGRELTVRFLVLSAVLDQGPDIEGVRDLVADVTNDLYAHGVRFLHDPIAFFRSLSTAIDTIEASHGAVKERRADGWAARNRTRASRYLLYAENARQALGYAVYRWGAPLALAQAVADDARTAGRASASPLVDFLKSRRSTEDMTKRLKTDRTRGLGKAIGDKAAHLFGKWAVYSYPLLVDAGEPAWGPWSFEIPFDSNAGRVLYRTGLLGRWASAAAYTAKKVLQPTAGKGGTTYLRVTNIRGMSVPLNDVPSELADAYRDLYGSHLRSGRPTAVRGAQIQRIPSALSLLDGGFSPGEIDDGLIKVGTTWCLNIAKPLCSECPLRSLCQGATRTPALITDVRT